MNRQLKRILDLVRRTGDRMVVTDPNGEDSYVVMGLDQYEALIDAADHRHPHEEDAWDEDAPEWTPESDGELIQTDGPEVQVKPAVEEDLPEDLRKAVEHDLAILESWKNEKERTETQAAPEAKRSEDEGKNDADEERFYLEPIE